MISLKVLEKAIERRDYRFLAKKLVEKLAEYDWDRDDVQNLIAQMQDSNK